MKIFTNKSIDYIYFPFTKDADKTSNKKFEDLGEHNISNDMFDDDLLKSLGREILKEKTPSLQELEQTLQEIIKKKEKKDKFKKENDFKDKNELNASSDSNIKRIYPLLLTL